MLAYAPLSFDIIFRKATTLFLVLLISVFLVKQSVIFSPFPSLCPQFPPHPLCQSIYQCGVDHSCGGFSFIFFALPKEEREGERGRREVGGRDWQKKVWGVQEKRYLDDEVKPFPQSFLSISHGQRVLLRGLQEAPRSSFSQRVA